MGKLSLSYNAYTLDQGVLEMTLRSIQSFRPHVDEIVFSEDGGIDSPEIRALVDQYLYHENVGASRCTNIGWEAATGDYVINAQTDTLYVSGNLRDLCVPDRVTNPRVVDADGNRVDSGWNNDQHSEFFCVPRALKEQYGMLDERCRTYMQDILYLNKIAPVHQPIDSVVICHLLHGTINPLTATGWDRSAQADADYQAFMRILHDQQMQCSGGMPIFYGQAGLLTVLQGIRQELIAQQRWDAEEAMHKLVDRLTGFCPIDRYIHPMGMQINFYDKNIPPTEG